MSRVTVLDTNWVGRPRSIAAALLESGGRHALVDPGPASTLPALRAGLAAQGLSVADLDALLLTHIHLDHAGASGSLTRENPRLAVYVHQLGATHMIDPTKLLASAARLWPDTLHQLFGETLPVPPQNLRILAGGETIMLGTQKFSVLYTPGHASHHVSYFDDAEGVVFVGDTTGIRIENGPYILPATPPPDIDLGIWDESLNAILARRPARLFLTHFGYADDPASHVAEFRERVHRWAEVARECLLAAQGHEKNSREVKAAAGRNDDAGALSCFVAKSLAEMEAHLGPVETEHHAFTAALDLSFLGLARYLRKRATTTAARDP
jgi:glyoxylase-like metal-dependent hydrolase (beta-lactamase superfamily II)